MSLWPLRLPEPPPTDDTVHVYAWPLEAELAPVQYHLHLLSEEERARAARFRFDRHRGNYVQAHSGMRRVLAACLQCAPGGIAFQQNEYGKPSLPGDPLQFNLSHTRGLCVLAVSRVMPLGVDVEYIREMDEAVASSHFSSRELATLRHTTGEAWVRSFYRIWTSKEALLKAEGFGIHVPLHSFDVEGDPEKPAALLAARPAAGFTRQWRMHDLRPGTGHHAAALAVGGDAKVECYTLAV